MKARAGLRLCALLVGVFASAAAGAKCTGRDAWTGADKNLHLAAGAIVAMAGTLQAGNRLHGFAWGVGLGAVKELADTDGSGTCSLQDFAITALGAAIGAQLGGVMFNVQRGAVSVSYRTTF